MTLKELIKIHEGVYDNVKIHIYKGMCQFETIEDTVDNFLNDPYNKFFDIDYDVYEHQLNYQTRTIEIVTGINK